MKHRGLFIMIFFAFALVLCSCDNETPENQNSIPVDPEVFFPCWRQSWKSGEWLPVTEKIYEKDCWSISIKEREDGTSEGVSETCLISYCDIHREVRIVDTKNRKYRIYEHYNKSKNAGDHEWESSILNSSFNPIVKGDVLVIICQSSMFVVQIIDVYNLRGIKVRYKIANVDLTEENCKFFDLDKFKWKKRTCDGSFDLGIKEIPLSTDSYKLPGTNKYPIGIFYDYFFGGYTNEFINEDLPSGPVARIAIIHESDYVNKGSIDLRQFRFKTWEDGLGNRREKANKSD
jgi:hypothetical protein